MAVVIYGHRHSGRALLTEEGSLEQGLRAKMGAELDANYVRYTHDGPLKLIHAEQEGYWKDPATNTVFIARPTAAAAARPPPPSLGDIEFDPIIVGSTGQPIATPNAPPPPAEWDLHPDQYAADHLYDHLQTLLPGSERWLVGCVAEGNPAQIVIVVGTQENLPNRNTLPFMWLDIPVARNLRLGGRGWHTHQSSRCKEAPWTSRASSPSTADS